MKMRTWFGLVIASLSLCVSANANVSAIDKKPSSSSKSPARPVADNELRILFVGNSLTGYNNMPGLFRALANLEGFDPYVESYLKFGQTLATQLKDAALRKTLTTQKWDYLVLQEYSDLPLRNVDTFEKSIEQFKNLVVGRGTKIVLFENWPYSDLSAGTMPQLERNYCKVANSQSASVAPVGLAVSSLRNIVDIYLPNDIKHPNAIGTYAVAISFLNFFYGVDARDVEHVGTMINTPDIYSGTALPVKLFDLDALYGQTVVEDAQDAIATIRPLKCAAFARGSIDR